jgi:hypothetical protein
MERTVLCMKWGTRYGPEYVNRLAKAVHGHMRAPVKVVCFTDDATGIDAGLVECRPLPPLPDVPPHLAVKPWRKLSLWQANLGEDLTGQDVLVLDVDLVVVGALDGFWEHEPEADFVVWENPTKKGSGIGNTSVFRFRVGSHPEIFQRFVADAEGVYRAEFRIEQEMISARLGENRVAKHFGRTPQVAELAFYEGLGIQRFWPEGWCLSFKEDLLPGWPQRWWTPVPKPENPAKIVAFHGKPDPDEAARGFWLDKHGKPVAWWKRFYKKVLPVAWLKESGW